MLKKLLVGIATVAMLFTFSATKADAFGSWGKQTAVASSLASGDAVPWWAGEVNFGAAGSVLAEGYLGATAFSISDAEATLDPNYKIGVEIDLGKFGQISSCVGTCSSIDMKSWVLNGGATLGTIDMINEVAGFGYVKGGTLSFNFKGELATSEGQAGGSYSALTTDRDYILGSSYLEGGVLGETCSFTFTKDLGNTSIAGATVKSNSVAYVNGTDLGYKDSEVHALGSGQVSHQTMESSYGAMASTQGSASFMYDGAGRTFASGHGQATTFGVSSVNVSGGTVHVKATSVSFSSASGF